MEGYQGPSLRSVVQRQSGQYVSNVQTGSFVAPAKQVDVVSTEISQPSRESNAVATGMVCRETGVVVGGIAASELIATQSAIDRDDRAGDVTCQR
jgi:hypothetical protein